MKTIFLNAKCSDMCDLSLKEDNGRLRDSKETYVPEWLPNPNIRHYGDYVQLEIDVETGQILKCPNSPNNFMTIIELKNNFHNTVARLNVSDLRIAEELGNGDDYFCTISASQMKRACRKLCGMKDCICGSVRGPQTHNGRRLIVMHEVREAGLVHGWVQV